MDTPIPNFLIGPLSYLKDLFLAPYYGWLVEILTENLRPDTTSGEAPEIPRYEQNRGPGSTSEVSFWTSKDVREVQHCHLNYAVADTQKWEQTATYYIDSHPATEAFVKNAGLGFAIPYLQNGQMHDYIPDFIVRLKTNPPIQIAGSPSNTLIDMWARAHSIEFLAEIAYTDVYTWRLLCLQ